MKSFALVCVWATGAVLLACASGSAEHGTKRELHYPLSCAGIKVGFATDAEVQRLYGKGYFVADEGFGGGRYYVDPKHQVTLHIEIFTDEAISLVEYQQDVHLPHKPTARIWKAAVTPHLTPDKKVQGGITLGASVQMVLSRYGKPTKSTTKKDSRVIEYDADERTMSGVAIDYDAKFRFRKNRLVSIELYNGE
jgi:hypothetical protein